MIPQGPMTLSELPDYAAPAFKVARTLHQTAYFKNSRPFLNLFNSICAADHTRLKVLSILVAYWNEDPSHR